MILLDTELLLLIIYEFCVKLSLFYWQFTVIALLTAFYSESSLFLLYVQPLLQIVYELCLMDSYFSDKLRFLHNAQPFYWNLMLSFYLKPPFSDNLRFLLSVQASFIGNLLLFALYTASFVKIYSYRCMDSLLLLII